MHILLISPPIEGIFPVGISYISAVLKKAGHDVDCFVYDNDRSLRQRLKNVDVIATGGLTTHIETIKCIIDQAKKFPVIKIIGGGIMTSEPELMLRFFNPDFAVLGEGEETIVELIACLENNDDISSVPGVAYLKDDKFICNTPRKEIRNLDALPYPDYESFNYLSFLEKGKPNNGYSYNVFDNPREYLIVCSRSCPFNCTFCYHPLGQKYRQRTIDSIMEELELVIPKYKINLISILDELFAFNEERIIEFCNRLKELIKTVPWEVKWGCQMRVDKLNTNILKIMKDAGCYMISYGFESYSATVLKSMKKFITPDQIHRAIHLTQSVGIGIQANFIFGDKRETLQTALETLEFWKKHSFISLGFILAIPNSSDYQYCVKTGIIKDKIEFLRNGFNLENGYTNFSRMSNFEFLYIKLLINYYIYKFTIKTRPLEKKGNSLTLRCPYCHQISHYNNFELNERIYIEFIQCKNCYSRFYVISKFYQLIFIQKNIITLISYFFNNKFVNKLKRYLKIVNRM